MVVDRYRKGLLAVLLADNILVQVAFNIHRFQDRCIRLLFKFLLSVLFDDLIAETDAFIADIYGWTGNQFLDFILILAAEGTVDIHLTFLITGHNYDSSLSATISLFSITLSIIPYFRASSAPIKKSRSVSI